MSSDGRAPNRTPSRAMVLAVAGVVAVAISVTDTGPDCSTWSVPVPAPRSLTENPPEGRTSSRLPCRLSIQLVMAPRPENVRR